MVGHTFAFGISQRHANAAVGDAAGAVHVAVVRASHLHAAVEAHFLHVDSFIARCGEAVVDPEERAYLHLLVGLAQLLHAVGCDAHNLARTDVAVDLVVEIRKTCRLARSGVCSVFLAYYYRRASQFVACGDDAVFCEQQH